MTLLSYRGHRFPAPIIQHAIWLYLRFTLSYRDVEGVGARMRGEPTVLVPPGPWCQVARMEAGFATRIMRLSTSAAMAVSPCWAGKMRARSFGPMIAL
jgi:hypothetical protein